ncbi:MAG: ADP-ribose [Geobacteraceae bacterium]|nr:MAG: ADP-ribose [Geobacteraceae bacterium]
METRNRAVLFEGLVVDLEQMEVRIGEKGWHTYQIVRHPGGVAVLPLHEDGTVTLIRQLRPAVDAVMLELPAGRLDAGEEPAKCGMRELGEETGLVAERLESLGNVYPSPGVFDEVIHLFLATGLIQKEDKQEDYEDIETVRLPLGAAMQMAMDGTISDGKTIAALFRAGGRGL